MPDSTEAHHDHSPVVLLIDDSEFVHRLLKARLKSESIQIVSEYEGQSGIERAMKENPSLILLDLDMPGIDGFETLRKLKEESATRNIPVIILSGQDTTQDKVTAFDLGAVDFVPKPFELTELRARIRSSLRISSLLSMLEQKAQIDGLSGLYNRSYFDNRWAEEYERCARQSTGLSLAVIDIDHFKSVNDSFGHPAGDAVISGVSNIILDHIRKCDIACRFGGEEFTLILPNTDPEQATSICERIRVECESYVWTRHPDHKITISIGIAGCSDGPTAQPTQWFEQADANLYKAKNSGRNKIIAGLTTGNLSTLNKAG